MPNLFRVGQYVIFFWANENDEPLHVHVAVKRPHKNATKIWLTQSGGCILAGNPDRIPMSTLNDLMELIAAQKDMILDRWKTFYMTDEVKYFC